MHPLVLEADEMQDYPEQGWTELIETMKAGSVGAQWRCLAEGQKVLTDRGLVPIELVKVGDQVWTHRGRWRPVVNVFDNGLQDCVRVSGRGHFGIEMTPDHKVLMGQLSRQKVGSKVLVDQNFAPISQARWDRRRQSAWASPVGPFPGDPVPTMSKLNTSSLEWLWLYGLYLAEGYSCDYDAGGQRHRRVSWCVNDVECDEVQARLASLGLTSHLYRQNRSVKVTVSGATVHDWLVEASGRLAHGKRLAPWAFGLTTEQRQAILDGMIYGDGYSGRRDRHEYVTVSHDLALGVKLLAQSLGNVCSISLKPALDRQIDGRVVKSGPCYSVMVQQAADQKRKQSVAQDGMVWSPVNPERDIAEIGERHVYDLEVAEDHSYVVEGVVVSNCHGVSRGVRDTYYRMTTGENPDLPFKVHRYMAPHRPTWSDGERRSKIAIYGGTEDNVDYRRNIFGEHGDTHNPVFVLARLMACVRINESSWATEYNERIYHKIKVNDELLRKTGMPIEGFLDGIPGTHLSDDYGSYWSGMDVGFTNDPSEILVFGVVKKTDVMRLLLRIQLQRVSAIDQANTIMEVFRQYGPRLKGFSMDKTGNGLPIWQETMRGGRLEKHSQRIKGYGFSEKKAVEFDDRPLERRERPQDAVIERNVVDFATDELRKLVDNGKLELPYDLELLTEWQGQQVTVVKDMGSAGAVKRKYSDGGFHTLDAGRTMIMGKQLENIESVLNAPKRQGPVLDQFFA